MSQETTTLSLPAAMQGRLWSARARDWAEIQEPLNRPLFETAYEAVGVGSGQRVLDIGCGAGIAAAVAAERGARVSGIDPAEGLIAIAGERVPDGDFRVGEMDDLPYADDAFDVVSGFNVFQYTSQPAAALSEARRVCRSGGTVVLALFGPPPQCEIARVIAALKPHLPELPPDAPGPFSLSDEARLRPVMEEAGLRVERLETLPLDFHYPNLDIAQRATLSAGPGVMAIQNAGEGAVRESLTKALQPFKTSDGGYRLENVFLWAVGRA